AGVNAGDGTHYFSLPGSGTAAIADLQNSTNVGTTGRWLFRVDGETGTCQDEFGQSISAPAHFYPYGTGVGDFIIRKRDTQSSGQFSASTPFVLYGTSYNKLWVNMDGMITFADGTSYHSIEPFPYSDPVVAALVEDVDTSVNVDGRVFYRQTTDTDILQRATNDVADRTGFTATWVFIATWQNVTYYDGDNDSPRNTFQVVMISDGDTSYVIFNYGEINWTIGADSDMHAVGGVNAGDGINYISLPGSGTATFGNLQNTTNDGTNGRWHFRVDCENNTICIDECASDPCHNGGSCADKVNGFSCTCVAGFMGENCDTRWYDCGDHSPCTAANRAQGKYFFIHSDVTKYVRCSAFGRCWVRPCAPSTVFNEVASVCTRTRG
ncbi:Alpha-tectorin, partial [Lamellibrachia satsuma]